MKKLIKVFGLLFILNGIYTLFFSHLVRELIGNLWEDVIVETLLLTIPCTAILHLEERVGNLEADKNNE